MKETKKIRQGYYDGSHSEIEVSKFDDWNPESIRDRGLNLVNFLERRWNLKFEDDKSKKEFLFLDFMNDDHVTTQLAE